MLKICHGCLIVGLNKKKKTLKIKSSFIFLPLCTNLLVPPLLCELQLETQLCERYVNQFHSVNISLVTSALHVLCTCSSETWITFNCTHMAGILSIPKTSEQQWVYTQMTGDYSSTSSCSLVLMFFP